MSTSISTDARVAVIGAGCSGITAVKHLLQADLTNIVGFEQNDQVGGNWIYNPKLSHSSVCETTHIISSKGLSEFEDFPMPEDYPDYPSHQQLLAYFQDYARHFGILEYYRFNTKVKSIVPASGQGWLITLSDGTEEAFDYVLIANGHHSAPRHPELPGTFSGRYLHSHAYKTNQPFAGERVLVIGAGNSGCDCAVEISRVANHVAMSMRSPQYIIPKFFLGKPTDSFNKNLLWLPKGLAAFLRKLSLRIQVGRYRDYNLPEPDFPVTSSHPTLNSELLYKIRHGKVHPRPAIQHIEGKTVTFADGQQATFDTIIAATGYRIVFPFLDKKLVDYEEADRVALYLKMFHPQHEGLIFIGLCQPQGCVWPLSEQQARLAANYITGRYQLPKNVTALAEKEADLTARTFSRAKRHSIEVYFDPFFNQLKRAIPKDAPEWPDKVQTTP